MSENALTFSELRKIQKEEKRKDELSELGDDFLIRAQDYLSEKQALEEQSREYRNAKRVLDKIVSLREDKIVKAAKIAVKSGVSSSTENFLPREKELFRELKQAFNDHRDRVDQVLESGARNKEPVDEPVEEETDDTSETDMKETKEEPDDEGKDVEPGPEEESSGEEPEAGDGYEVVKIITEVPEFMGTDLETYGPFDEGDEAELPEENAEILVNRGNAEKL
ncbi:MAG: hypothetical protein ABEJ69_02550 [Candidatus Nanohaloarchaea archaeon]